MRVLLVHSDLLGGGTERVLVTLARALPVAEKAICYCPSNHPDPPGELVEALRRDGVEVLRVSPRATSPLYPWRVARAIGHYRPDVVHFHGTLMGIVGGLLRGLFPRRVVFVYTQHPHHSQDARWLRVLARGTFGRLDHVVCVSQAVREDLLAFPGLACLAGRTTVIHNGIDLTAFEEEPSAEEIAAVRGEIGAGEGERVIGSVGLLWRIKGYHVLLPAFARVLASFPRARLALVGRGEQEEELRALARELGVAERVSFLGWRGDVARLLRAFDLYVQPSTSEGLPLAPLEAGAVGLPLVATRVGGMPEAVVDGRTGLLVPPEDAKAMAAAMLELLGNPDKARRLGEAARRRVWQEFSAETMAGKHVRLYTALVNEVG